MNLKWILEDLLDTFTSSVICIHMKQQNVTLNVMQITMGPFCQILNSLAYANEMV